MKKGITSQICLEIGKTAGQIDASLSKLQSPLLCKPQDKSVIMWDMGHLFYSVQFLEWIKDEKKRDLASKCLLFAIGHINRLENDELPSRKCEISIIKLKALFVVSRSYTWRYK